MRMFNIVALAIAAGIAGAPEVASAERYWHSIGNGCVPTDNTITAANYDSRGFGVGFKGTSTGAIDLYCPVSIRATGSTPTYNSIKMSYRDPDGTGTSSRVRAFFLEATDGSNSSTVKCTADSNGNATTGYTTWSCNFFPGFVPATNKSYWVEVYIERTTSSYDPELLAVWVE
jgi:hypothetical protein